MKTKVFFAYFLCRSIRGGAYTFFEEKKVYNLPAGRQEKLVARNLCIMGMCKGKFVQVQSSKATLTVNWG